MLQFIRTNTAPMPGACSQGVVANTGTHDIVFLAGQTAGVPDVDGEPTEIGGVGPQTTRCLKNILAVVREAGGDAGSLVELTVFLKDGDECGVRRAVLADRAYRAFFAEHGRTSEKGNMPARTRVMVSEIPWETEYTCVEIKATAAIFRPLVTR